jgi:hypothetical protein
MYGGNVIRDLWGPAEVESIGHHKYAHMHRDQYSSEDHVTFLKRKKEAFQSFKDSRAWVRSQRNAKIKINGADRGGEFMGHKFKGYLRTKGLHAIVLYTIPPNLMAKLRGSTVLMPNEFVACCLTPDCLRASGPRRGCIQYG